MYHYLFKQKFLFDVKKFKVIQNLLFQTKMFQEHHLFAFSDALSILRINTRSEWCRVLIIVICWSSQFLSRSLLPACHLQRGHICRTSSSQSNWDVQIEQQSFHCVNLLLDGKTHLRIQRTEQTIKQCRPKWTHAKETPASLLHISKSTLELGYFIYCGWPTVDIGTP